MGNPLSLEKFFNSIERSEILSVLFKEDRYERVIRSSLQEKYYIKQHLTVLLTHGIIRLSEVVRTPIPKKIYLLNHENPVVGPLREFFESWNLEYYEGSLQIFDEDSAFVGMSIVMIVKLLCLFLTENENETFWNNLGYTDYVAYKPYRVTLEDAGLLKARETWDGKTYYSLNLESPRVQVFKHFLEVWQEKITEYYDEEKSDLQIEGISHCRHCGAKPLGQWDHYCWSCGHSLPITSINHCQHCGAKPLMQGQPYCWNCGKLL